MAMTAEEKRIVEADPDDVKGDGIADDAWLDNDCEIDDDIDEDAEDDVDDEVDEWAAGREDMFREFDAQGYMEED